MVNIALSLILSLFALSFSNILHILFTWAIVLLLILPLGFVIIYKFSSPFSFCLQILLSFAAGTIIFGIVGFFVVTLGLPLYFTFLVQFLLFVLFFYKMDEQKISLRAIDIKKEALLLALFVILILYYAITPLTSCYTFARDYDLFALGILNTGSLQLPFYNIPSYYPPLVSLFTAHIALFNTFTNINKIMEVYFHLLVPVILVLTYVLGFILTDKRITAFIFPLSFCLVSSFRNHVGGGASYPALFGIFFAVCFIIFLCLSFKFKSKRSGLLSIFSLSLVALSHFDIFFPLVFGIMSLFIALIVFREYQAVKSLAIVCLIAAFVISPFIVREYRGYQSLKKLEWSKAKIEMKNKGESHPKPVREIVFFNGKPAFFFLFVSLLGCVYGIFRKKNIYRNSLLPTLCLVSVLWGLTYNLQNNFLFLSFITQFIHIYPLNIILWSGMSIFLGLSISVGLLMILDFLQSRMWSGKGSEIIFLWTLIISVLIVVADHEIVNMLNTYRKDNSGSLKRALVNRQGYMNEGDFYCLKKLAEVRKDITRILTTRSYSGFMASIVTFKPQVPFFYDVSYVDASLKKEIGQEFGDAGQVLYGDEGKTSILLERLNISHIFIPSTHPYPPSENGHWRFMNHSIICEKGGAKIISTHKCNTTRYHFEAEDFINGSKNTYKYGITNNFTTVAILSPTKVSLPVLLGDNDKIIVKYLSAPFAEPWHIDNMTFGGKSKKVEFVQEEKVLKTSSFVITTERRKVPLEIDWIEIEQR